MWAFQNTFTWYEKYYSMLRDWNNGVIVTRDAIQYMSLLEIINHKKQFTISKQNSVWAVAFALHSKSITLRTPHNIFWSLLSNNIIKFISLANQLQKNKKLFLVIIWQHFVLGGNCHENTFSTTVMLRITLTVRLVIF